MDIINELLKVFDSSMQRQQNMPIKTQLSIIYSGEYALKYDTILMELFRQVWGEARVSHICRGIKKGTGVEAVSEKKIEFRDAVNQMAMCDQNVFASFKEATIYMLYDIRDYTSKDEFCLQYEQDKEDMKQYFCYTQNDVVRMVIFDNTNAKFNAINDEIKQYLDGLTANKDKTMVFGTRLNSVRLISMEELYQRIAKLIALVGSPAYKIDSTTVYGALNGEKYRTISLNIENRPNKDISITIVKALISCLKDSIKNVNVSAEMICKRLKVTEKGCGLTDEIYEQLKGRLPSGDSLKGLPRSKPNKIEWNTLSFSDFNKLTYETFEPFYEQNYRPILESEETGNIIKENVKSLIETAFTFREFASVTEISLDDFEKRWNVESRSYLPGCIVETYIDTKNKMILEPYVKKEILTAFRNKKRTVDENVTILSEILDSMNQTMFVNDARVENFYSQKVRLFLQQNQEEFIQRATNNLQNKEQLMAYILSEAKRMIKQQAEFRYPFEEEYMERTGEVHIFDNIKEQLLSTTINDCCYCPLVAPTKFIAIILMNRYKRKDVLQETQLYLSMKNAIGASDRLIDNENENGIEIITIYELNSL